MRMIFIKTQYGVIVELRQWGQDGAKWHDYYATEWQMMPAGEWESMAHNKVTGVEIGRWYGTADVYETIKQAGSNGSGFRNFGDGVPK
jgi:hypothetical protein